MEAELCELKASLVCIAGSRPATANQELLYQDKKTTKTKKTKQNPYKPTKIHAMRGLKTYDQQQNKLLLCEQNKATILFNVCPHTNGRYQSMLMKDILTKRKIF